MAECLYANDVDVRRDLLSAVVLTGGLSLTPGPREAPVCLHKQTPVCSRLPLTSCLVFFLQSRGAAAVFTLSRVSLCSGLAERLSDELHGEAFGPCNSHSGLKVKLVCPSNQTERRAAAWLGGSILASLGTFQEMWISKQEYEEHGVEILEKKAL